MKNLRLSSKFQQRLATVNTGALSTTHLLEKGKDFRFIQELLRYGSSRIIRIHSYASDKSLAKIISLSDTIVEIQSTVKQHIKMSENK